MTSIYKYPFSISNAFTLGLPRGAQILSVQVQDAQPVLWAMVDTEEVVQLREFRVFGTGQPMPDLPRVDFLATIQMDFLCWHIFVVRPDV